MKALTALAWVTGIILVVFVILLMAAPTKVHIEKSQAINAPYRPCGNRSPNLKNSINGAPGAKLSRKPCTV